MPETSEFFASSTVLIVGRDQRGSSKLQQLMDHQMNLIYAAGADQVVDIISAGETVDLVLLDIDSLNGKALDSCMWLKTNTATRLIPVVGLGDENQDISRWLNAGINDFVFQSTSPVLSLARIKSELELKFKTDLLADIASLDGLTTLCNRQRMEEYLDIEWRRSLREYYPLSLMKIDIDSFAAFNDRYGVGCGDECLKRIARVIKSNCLRAADMVARYGGDEFMVLLPGIELDNALLVAQNVVSAVASLAIENEQSDVSDVVTISVGLATIEPSRDGRFQDLIDEVEEELSGAQLAGGNQAQGIAI